MLTVMATQHAYVGITLARLLDLRENRRGLAV
jgi:hypothetical protein